MNTLIRIASSARANARSAGSWLRLKHVPLVFRSRVLLLTFSGLFALLCGGFYVMQQDRAASVLSHVVAEEPADAADAGDDIIRPVLISGSSSIMLLGTVLSHETANIYPRRDGIVEDVYVDIGDTVKKGQVVALLLPKGVEGQSAAMIAEKQARKSQADTDLSTAEHVADETVINTRQKINEKQTALLIAEREQQALLQKLFEADANVSQMQEQAFTVVQNARQLVERIILGGNSRSGIEINDRDLLPNLGIQDSGNAVRYDIVYRFNSLYSAEKEYRAASEDRRRQIIDHTLLLGLDALAVTNTLLQYTPTQPSGNGITQFSYQQMTNMLNDVVRTQDMIYKAKEKLEDARNSFQILTSAEPEIFRAYQSGDYEAARSNRVRLLEEELRTTNNALALTEANQQQMVEMKKRQVDIAAAVLQSEYAQSGHRQIQSPFTGMISKRFIAVGEQVMPSSPAFELVDVPTTLAKKARAEIAFGLPEDLIGVITMGDLVTFTLSANDNDVLQATVTRMSPQVDGASRTIAIQARIEEGVSLPRNATVRVRIPGASVPVYRLPSTVVKREDGRNIVWTLSGASAVPTAVPVEVRSEDGEFAEVTGDLSEETPVLVHLPEFHPLPVPRMP